MRRGACAYTEIARWPDRQIISRPIALEDVEEIGGLSGSGGDVYTSSSGLSGINSKDGVA
jgi:hypothetical protein